MILIIGASGFVGRNIRKVFDKKKIEYQSKNSKNFNLLDYNHIQKELKRIKPDYIINCAAVVGSLNYVTEQAANILDVNLKMILNLYKAVQTVSPSSTIINPIANCAYPGDLKVYREDELFSGSVHQSVLSYGTSRRVLVNLSQVYFMQFRINSINLLVPNMYGPFDSTDPNKAHALNALISKAVKCFKENEKIINVWGSGIAIREWLYAQDLGEILFLIVSGEIKHGLFEPINIAQNYGLSIKELISIIISKVDNSLGINWDNTMPDGAIKKVMDDTRFKKVFGKFKFTDFEIGIENTINYYTDLYPY